METETVLKVSVNEGVRTRLFAAEGAWFVEVYDLDADARFCLVKLPTLAQAEMVYEDATRHDRDVECKIPNCGRFVGDCPHHPSSVFA